ncbi:adenosylcobinamide amidohydrolase [Alkalilimnicola ehrlichii]|uniref:adenosylcobinamide amidohydrolase n=1 Tax=Alkalilimnicola ehrlichii TaxID=351052 RepID=UPI00384B65CE
MATQQQAPVTVTRDPAHLVVDLGAPRPILSNAAIGGGWRTARYVVNRTVAAGWNPPDIDTDMSDYLGQLGLPSEQCVGLLTAVHMQNLVRRREQWQGWAIEALATVGVRNAARAGGAFPLAASGSGTINVIVLIDGWLAPAAMVDAVQTAVEAKAAALAEAAVPTATGEIATGTTTDTVTVATLGRQPSSVYAGTATTVGHCIGRAVHGAISEGVQAALARLNDRSDVSFS